MSVTITRIENNRGKVSGRASCSCTGSDSPYDYL